MISETRFTHTERRQQKDTRRIKGQTYQLAGKGTREAMEEQAGLLRLVWKHVAVRPFGWSRYGVAADDWSVWVNERRETQD